jgi:hypothetical protein
MTEEQINKIVGDIEARYIDLPEDEWFKILQILVSRCNV